MSELVQKQCFKSGVFFNPIDPGLPETIISYLLMKFSNSGVQLSAIGFSDNSDHFTKKLGCPQIFDCFKIVVSALKRPVLVSVKNEGGKEE